MWAISGTSLAAPADGEWTGTLSCGELQNSPNAKSKAPFTGAVTLTIHKNSASLERVWPKGKEHLEGTVSRGQPIKLEGQGWFFGKEANAWKVRVKLFEIGQRYEGEGVLESVDGLTKYRDCKVSVESAIAPTQKSTLPNAKVAKKAPKNASKPEPEPEPANPVKPADPKLPPQSNAQAPNGQPVSPTESVADTRSSNSSPPNVTASEPTQATPPSQPVEAIVPAAVPASAPVAVAKVASASSPGPMQSNATNSRSSGYGVIFEGVLAGIAVTIVCLLIYRRRMKSPSLGNRQVKETASPISSHHELPNEISDFGDPSEPLEIDLSFSSPKAVRHETQNKKQVSKNNSQSTDSKAYVSGRKFSQFLRSLMNSRSSSGKSTFSTIKYGSSILAVIVVLGYVGNYWINTNKTSQAQSDDLAEHQQQTANSTEPTKSSSGVLAEVSQLFSSNLKPIFSPVSNRDGKFSTDIDLSKQTEKDIEAYIGVGNMVLGQEPPRMRDAEVSFIAAAKIAKNIHGDDSIEYAKTSMNLAGLYTPVCSLSFLDKGSSGEGKDACRVASSLYKDVVSIFVKRIGNASEDANSAREELADLLDSMGNRSEAADVRNQIIPKEARIK